MVLVLHKGFFHLEIMALFLSHGSSFTQRFFLIWRSWLCFQAMVLVLHEGFFHLEIVVSSSSHGSNFT
jgi:hypothetical protein